MEEKVQKKKIWRTLSAYCRRHGNQQGELNHKTAFEFLRSNA